MVQLRVNDQNTSLSTADGVCTSRIVMAIFVLISSSHLAFLYLLPGNFQGRRSKHLISTGVLPYTGAKKLRSGNVTARFFALISVNRLRYNIIALVGLSRSNITRNCLKITICSIYQALIRMRRFLRLDVSYSILLLLCLTH